MSLQAMLWAIEDVPDLEPGGKLLLIVLGNYAGSDWTCFPSQERLAADTSMTSRSVRSWLAKLEARGLIHRAARFAERGKRTSDLIRLRPPESAADITGNERQRPPETISGEPPNEPPIEPRPSNDGLSPTSGDAASPAAIAFGAYNAFALAHGKSTALKLTDDRRRHLNARIRECGSLEAFLVVLDSIETSAFLMGSTPARFMISLDFILQPSSFTKLREGFYHRDRPNGGSTTTPGGLGGREAEHDRRTGNMLTGLALAAQRHGERNGRDRDLDQRGSGAES